MSSNIESEPEFKLAGSRRKFLAYSGATITATGLFLAGCDDETVSPMTNLKAPTNLMADNSMAGKVVLSWKSNSSGEDGFRIQRSTDMNSGFAQIAEVAAGMTSYTDTDVTDGTEYYYRVQAFKGAKTSAYSAAVSSNNQMAPVYLGEGDVGILNYAYALEQLEAAFYTAVVAGGYYDSADSDEKQIMMDLKKHEIIHREFFKAALTAAAPDKIIPGLAVDFSAIDFNDRMSVLGTAKAFEDLGVSAYNGAGQFITNPDYLVLAGKIVSVEARHASAIRDLLNPKSMDFAGSDIINMSGLEITRAIPDVLSIAGSYIATQLDASGLPTGGYQVTV